MDLEDAWFSSVSEDILINIFAKLEEDDPRYLAGLSCVCTRFNQLIEGVCWKRQCLKTMPSVVSDLLQPRFSEPPGGWAALQRVAVCCPGLWHAGILLENSDLGLERDIGPSDQYFVDVPRPPALCSSNSHKPSSFDVSSTWSLVDDLQFELGLNAELAASEDVSSFPSEPQQGCFNGSCSNEQSNQCFHSYPGEGDSECEDALADEIEATPPDNEGSSTDVSNEGQIELKRKESEHNHLTKTIVKKQKTGTLIEPHLANGVWNLTREQGNKLLASRFRSDSLYICDWPGCIHVEEKRNYRIFRGIFKNFKSSYVWRNIRDMKAKKTCMNCAFCLSKGTWDMLNTFCLKRSFEYHDDGEPSVRAFVCENGHVAGAWTDRPIYP